jgi:PAS domain S-box-containing protein
MIRIGAGAVESESRDDGRWALVQDADDGERDPPADAADERERQAALEQARRDAEQSTRRLLLLQEITAALSSAMDEEAVAAVVVERVRDVMGAAGATIRLVRGDALVLVAHRDLPSETRERFGSVPLDGTYPVAEAARRDRAAWIESPEEMAARFPAAAATDAAQAHRAWAIVPLAIRGRTLGAMSLMFAEPRSFDLEARAFVLSIAAQTAQALDRALLFAAERGGRETAQRASERLARLQQVTAAFSRARTADDVAEVLVGEAMTSLGVVSAVAYVRDGDTLRLVGSRGDAAAARDRLGSVPLDAPLPSAAAARSGEPLWLEGAETIAAAYPLLLEVVPAARWFRAVAALPLHVGDRLIGAAAFAFARVRTLDRDERELFASVAALAAQALDRARSLDAEREARAAEARTRALLDAIFENAPLGLGFFDTDLRFARVNPVLAETNGLPPEAHVGKTARELLPGLPMDDIERAWREVLRTGTPVLDVEISGETPAAPGKRRHWRESWYPVRSGDAVLGIGTLVREITAEREASEFQRNVLGIVGHDLRNPLSAILTSAQLLPRLAADPDAPARLGGRIAANAQRMQKIIDVLVDYARVRGGQRVPIRRVPCDLARIVATVVDECESSRPGCVIHARVEPGVTGEWDPNRIAQVVANLLSNALDHGSPGTPVELSCGSDGADVVVEVANEGAPIPADVLPTIFEPFRRGEPEGGGGHEGLGLGLFIARSIAVAHGGGLEARSAPGERIVFALRLPRAAPP